MAKHCEQCGGEIGRDCAESEPPSDKCFKCAGDLPIYRRKCDEELTAAHERIAELEEANRDAVYLAAAVQERADALRTAIEAKAARFKQQAKDAKDAGDVAWAAMCLGASSDLLTILKKSGERADGVE